MESKKRSISWAQVIVFVVCAIITLGIAIPVSTNYTVKKVEEDLRQIFDEVDKRLAVEEICEQKGKVEELERLLTKYAGRTVPSNLDAQDFIGAELDLISNWPTKSNNPYINAIVIDLSTVDSFRKSTEQHYLDICSYIREILSENIRLLES